MTESLACVLLRLRRNMTARNSNIIISTAMVVAVAYMLIFEVVLSHVPAVINKFTVEHRLFNLLCSWTTVLDGLPSDAPFQYSPQPPWVHLVILSVYVIGVLGLAAFVVRYREYITAEEG